jgi:acyl carrier protein
MGQVAEKIRRFIVDDLLFGQEEDMPSDDASLLETGVVDSTGVLELVAFLEHHFEIRVEDSELVPENLDSVTRLVDFVRRKKEADASHSQNGNGSASCSDDAPQVLPMRPKSPEANCDTSIAD